MLWSSAIVDRGERRESGEFFNTPNFKGVLAAHLPDDGRDQDLQDEAQLARIYFDGQLEQQFPLGVRAAYADFLLPTKPKGVRSQQFYAQTAVESYVQLAQAILNDPYRILVVSDILLRAAAIAKGMQGSGHAA